MYIYVVRYMYIYMKIFLIGDCWEGCLKIKKNLFLCFRQAQGKLEIFGRGSFKIENIYFFVSDKLKEDWRLLGGDVSKYTVPTKMTQGPTHAELKISWILLILMPVLLF